VKKEDIIAPKLCEKHDKKRLGRRPVSGDANRTNCMMLEKQSVSRYNVITSGFNVREVTPG